MGPTAAGEIAAAVPAAAATAMEATATVTAATAATMTAAAATTATMTTAATTTARIGKGAASGQHQECGKDGEMVFHGGDLSGRTVNDLPHARSLTSVGKALLQLSQMFVGPGPAHGANWGLTACHIRYIPVRGRAWLACPIHSEARRSD
jgi:hypothetical protein